MDLKREQDWVDETNQPLDVNHEIKERLDQMYKIRSIMLCQASRNSWSLKGERNT